MTKINLVYGSNELASGRDVDGVAELCIKMQNAREGIKKEFADLVECYAQNCDFGRFKIEVVGEEGNLEIALRKCFSIVGLPEYIGEGSDYAFVNKILAEYGKKAKWSFIGSRIGKSVVNLKK